MKVGIIGMGWVGASVAIATLQRGVARTLVLHDVKEGLAEGEAMDLAHGSSFYPTCRVEAGGLDAMQDADAVVLAAGRGGEGDESRLSLLAGNAEIARSVGRQLRGFGGLVVVVTNPVDVMTQLVTEASGLDPWRVVGTGTMLDTARLRQVLGAQLGLDARSIHAQVLGEHGDSEVCVWSRASIGGVSLRQYPGWDPSFEADIAGQVRRAAYEIISRKGATNHAIGLVTAFLLEAALRGGDRVLTVTRVQSGAMGFRDVALSLPSVVTHAGVARVLEPELDSDEREALEHSAEVLRKARADLG
ncbi:MAG TPA: L-lactate dehydrogenase [Myxococcales bacterium LLY-WYZ-16_1]|nr:L-lactate dehydrogenase [Myxococcales bacterium LLY-WYZ-16_1]